MCSKGFFQSVFSQVASSQSFNFPSGHCHLWSHPWEYVLGKCLGKIPLNTLPPLKPFVSYIINENICFVDFFLGGFRKDINLYQPSEKLGIIGLAVFSYINYTHANRYDNQIIYIRFLHVNQEIRIKGMELRSTITPQLTLNKCTLLDCTNTKNLLYCIHWQYNYSVPYYRRTLFWYRHTHMTFPPPGSILLDFHIPLLSPLPFLATELNLLVGSSRGTWSPSQF